MSTSVSILAFLKGDTYISLTDRQPMALEPKTKPYWIFDGRGMAGATI